MVAASFASPTDLSSQPNVTVAHATSRGRDHETGFLTLNLYMANISFAQLEPRTAPDVCSEARRYSCSARVRSPRLAVEVPAQAAQLRRAFRARAAREQGRALLERLAVASRGRQQLDDREVALGAQRAAREAAPELLEGGQRARWLAEILLVDATDVKQRNLSPQPATGGLRAQAGQRGRPGSIGPGRGALRQARSPAASGGRRRRGGCHWTTCPPPTRPPGGDRPVTPRRVPPRPRGRRGLAPAPR